MNNVKLTFRDGIDNFPPAPRPRVTNVLECDERNRRVDRYVGVIDMLLIGLTDKDRDYLNVMTYGELLDFAIDSLRTERKRIA